MRSGVDAVCEGGFLEVHPVSDQAMWTRVSRAGSGNRCRRGVFSAELSKLPQVVEVTATDASSRLLKVQAPKVFKLLKAHEAKIKRIPSDFGNLDFPANHFDVVVCADALHRAASLLRVLREVRRVLKPGGLFVGIREPVRPLMIRPRKNRDGKMVVPPGYAVSEYRSFFEHAGLKLELKRVVLSRGVKYFFDKAVNGLTHARYALVATKAAR